MKKKVACSHISPRQKVAGVTYIKCKLFVRDLRRNGSLFFVFTAGQDLFDIMGNKYSTTRIRLANCNRDVLVVYDACTLPPEHQPLISKPHTQCTLIYKYVIC